MMMDLLVNILMERDINISQMMANYNKRLVYALDHSLVEHAMVPWYHGLYQHFVPMFKFNGKNASDSESCIICLACKIILPWVTSHDWLNFGNVCWSALRNVPGLQFIWLNSHTSAWVWGLPGWCSLNLGDHLKGANSCWLVWQLNLPDHLLKNIRFSIHERLRFGRTVPRLEEVAHGKVTLASCFCDPGRIFVKQLDYQDPDTRTMYSNADAFKHIGFEEFSINTFIYGIPSQITEWQHNLRCQDSLHGRYTGPQPHKLS